MMKRLVQVVLAAVCLLSLASCGGKEDVLHMGIDAEILAIDSENTILEVRGLDQNSKLGERCRLDCTDADMIYVNYDNHDLKEIAFADLQVGDQLVLSIYESEFAETEDNIVRVHQVQLGTQRLN